MTRTTGLRTSVALAIIIAFNAKPARTQSLAGAALLYDIPSEDLSQALQAVARVAGRQIILPADAVAGRTAPALSGRFSANEAVARLLSGTGLTADITPDAILVHSIAPARVPRPAVPTAGLEEEAPRIVVTGTEIRGASPVGSSVITLGRKAIEQSGYTTTEQLVHAIPQNFGGGPNEGTSGLSGLNGAAYNTAFGSSVNLRGLGPSSTLTLLDGNRPALGGAGGIFADLSMIPASAIDRIEILTDGASSLYGSDAVAGVVNIIPRKAFRGAETNITQGTADGTANELQISQLVGLKWSGGHVMAAYEYEHRGRLGAEDRSFFTEDLRRFGGPDARSPYGDPGTIFAVGQSFAIPGGQDGRHLTASQLVAGTQNLNDDVRGTDILPRQTRHSVYAAATQAITSDLSVYASGLYTHRDFDQRHVSIFGTALTVTSANPFYVDPIGTGDPIMVDYRLSDAFGTEHLVGRAMGYTAVAGATLDHGAWEIDLHGSFGRQVERYHTLNAPNFARLDAALADPDPATAFNPFGSMATDNDPALIDTLRGFQSTRNRYAVWSVATKADGPLIDLPAGALRIAIGGEVRADRFGYASTDGIYSETPSSFSIPTDERKLVAGFAEVRLPIFSPDHPGPLARRLDLAASVRIEHYNDFGTTTNPKVGLSWEPVAGLTTRANYGTSFRAPGFNDLRQGALFQLFYTEALADPRAPTGFTNALVLVGNKPGIGPERARTITAGFEAKPSALPGLTISATWFDIRYRDRIEDLSGQAETVLANRAIYQQIINDAPDAATVSGYYASPSFSNFGNIAAGDIQAIVDVRNQNLAIVHEAGLDFDIDTTLHLLGGQVDIGLAGTYLFYLKQAISRSAPATNLAGTTGNPTPLRWRAHAGWNRGPFGFTSAINYTDAYRNTLVIPTAPVKSYLTVDAQLSWDIARKGGRPSLRLALNATNLFDRRPPFVVNPNGLTTVGYDPDNASAIGRDLSIQLTARW